MHTLIVHAQMMHLTGQFALFSQPLTMYSEFIVLKVTDSLLLKCRQVLNPLEFDRFKNSILWIFVFSAKERALPVTAGSIYQHLF